MCSTSFSNNLLVAMAASLAFLSIVRALTIDNQLQVIKNDCYERLAIGQRLGPKSIYKTFDLNTVSDCQMACTKEKDICKAFSIGIGVKGNGTCELSSDHVKETADLKPIGTLADTDYDLYIKKLGCKLVIDNTKKNNYGSQSQKPVQESSADNYGANKPSNSYGPDNKPSNGYDTRPPPPADSSYDKPLPPPSSSLTGNDYSKPSNNYENGHHPAPSGGKDETYHVQALVSIANGPDTHLHPVHAILVGEGSYGPSDRPPSRPSGPDYGNLPPFRPPELNHPYDDTRPTRPRPDDYNRPEPGYGPRPERPLPVPYDDGLPPPRPLRPDYDARLEPGMYRPNERNEYLPPPPPKRPFRPNDYSKPMFDMYEQRPVRPLPDRYGSYIPHPDDYNKGPRPQDYDYLFRPNEIDRYDDKMPIRRPEYGYNTNDRPVNMPNYDERPSRPYERPLNRPSYDDIPSRPIERPSNRPSYDDRPSRPMERPSYDDRPSERPYDRPINDSPYGQRPSRPSYDDRPSRPNPPPPNNYIDTRPPYQENKPRPDYNNNQNSYTKPQSNGDTNNSNAGNSYDRPDNKPNNKPSYSNANSEGGNKKGSSDKIVTQSVGTHGEKITSIITPLNDACFRRVLAGKRVSQGFVKRSLNCETLEECQQECADEKRFVCEGFNYRLDPTGRGKGECELLSLPLSRLDIGHDLYPDPDYDYYERDRNAASANCRQRPGGGGYPSPGGYDRPGGGYGRPPSGYGGSSYGGSSYGGSSYGGSSYGGSSYGGGSFGSYGHGGGYPAYGSGGRRPAYDDRRPVLRPPGDRWPEDEFSYGGNRRPRPGSFDDGYRPSGNRRGDFSYHQSHHSQQNYDHNHSHHSNSYHFNDRNEEPPSGVHYLPAIVYYRPATNDIPSYEPAPPQRRPNKYYNRDKDYWGYGGYSYGSYGGSYGNAHPYFNDHNHHQYSNRNRFDFDKKYYFLPTPTRVDKPKDWGLYGGTYGHGATDNLYYTGYTSNQNFDYWGFNKFNKHEKHHFGDLPPGVSHLPFSPSKPSTFDVALYESNGPFPPDNIDNSILPAEPRRKTNYNFLKDECSLRTATGFKLHKGIVKKYYAVPNIYECELLCYKEKEFPCASYAYRYTLNPSVPTENCYLSNRNYKELDYYTDLQPDRDYDIYTMNNPKSCAKPVVVAKENSECFWRVRSGQRLEHKVVRDSLSVKSIVDCQISCLLSHKFTCRAFSFRYGSPVIGGSIDNCQLTDWPFYELDPVVHFIPESGFEIYERGSFGHGCEPDHFGIRGREQKGHNRKVDQLCYVGFGVPARLLPGASRKSLWSPTELECKKECSRARARGSFQCMSFSYRTTGPKGLPNCELSDVLQRDLLPNVDFVQDSNAKLFAWDNYNPQCVAVASEPAQQPSTGHPGIATDRSDYGGGFQNALDTWRVYTVNGYPCRRGSFCKENREAGFWYCEIEGGSHNSWDYCCRPDHQCGYSNGYNYEWCYVGPSRTQWRKCSDRYYPYIGHSVDKIDTPPRRPYFPSSEPWIPLSSGQNYIQDIPPPPPYRPGIRPNRPPAPPTDPPPRPSLNEYEMQFDNQFLDPPRPGGFGQPRHWPVSYLHKEMPPVANSDEDGPILKNISNKLSAIENLINVIKSNDLKNVEFHIANNTNKNEILFVRIPLPTNLTNDTSIQQSEKMTKMDENKVNNTSSNKNLTNIVSLEPIDIVDNKQTTNIRSQKSLPVNTFTVSLNSIGTSNITTRPTPIYRKSYIERTNVTSHGRRSRNYRIQ